MSSSDDAQARSTPAAEPGSTDAPSEDAPPSAGVPVSVGPASPVAPADKSSTSGEGAEGGARDATERRSRLVGVASTLAGAAGPVISAAARPVDHFASGARRFIGERSGARVRRVRKMGRQPLANLWELHPEARRASIRELGLVTVPLDKIAGTAVEGAAQRGGDFLPLRDRRGADWRGRWQRILTAVEGLVNLPPVELIKLGDSYWVVDGHNRVAAGLYTGQVAIDALVDELRLPGAPSDHAPATIAPYLEGSQDLRAAGIGRLTRTTTRPDVTRQPTTERAADEADEDAGGDGRTG